MGIYFLNRPIFSRFNRLISSRFFHLPWAILRTQATYMLSSFLFFRLHSPFIYLIYLLPDLLSIIIPKASSSTSESFILTINWFRPSRRFSIVHFSHFLIFLVFQRACPSFVSRKKIRFYSPLFITKKRTSSPILVSILVSYHSYHSYHFYTFALFTSPRQAPVVVILFCKSINKTQANSFCDRIS
jgi:hypothetical protein